MTRMIIRTVALVVMTVYITGAVYVGGMFYYFVPASTPAVITIGATWPVWLTAAHYHNVGIYPNWVFEGNREPPCLHKNMFFKELCTR